MMAEVSGRLITEQIHEKSFGFFFVILAAWLRSQVLQVPLSFRPKVVCFWDGGSGDAFSLTDREFGGFASGLAEVSVFLCL